ncbi:pyridoxal phosphate-dependent transferase [Aspergillus pseudoustus]|uniref:Aspartate aminotransferase n=1 Tax=Aspergillus pseudoustus TaxID=1810923 RepID=A0ABR4J710_9EURO
MASDLVSLVELPRDEAFAITADFVADTHPQKVSLGAGVYRDENSKPWVLPSVKEAFSTLDHEYLPIHGSDPFLTAARDLILGQDQEQDQGQENNVISIQTISGTGANHLGAAFLAETLHPKPTHVFISDPTWSNHHLIWEVAAPHVLRRTYPYYDPSSRSLDFDGMISTLESEAVENDVVMLHACAHNPTGIDPSPEQWRAIAELVRRKRLFPLFDAAYQGFASGDLDRDAWAVRYFRKALFGTTTATTAAAAAAAQEDGRAGRDLWGPQGMGIAQSFAKNFGLYGERVGAFHLVLPPPPHPISSSTCSPLPSPTPFGTGSPGARSHLLRLVRASISNAPQFGSRIVALILSDTELTAMWKADLRTMSGRIKRMRLLLRDAIEKHGSSSVGDWCHLEAQIGMFSYTGLGEDHVRRLREVHHVYLMRSGRASLCGVTESNVEYVAGAIAEVVRYYRVEK